LPIAGATIGDNGLDYDRAYSNGAFIPGSEAYPARWLADAAAFRDSLGGRARLGIAYGSGVRNFFDLFLPPGDVRGLLIFIHGGYWMKFGPESWSHLATGALARGFACAMPAYTLAPEARIRDMTREIARAVTAASTLVSGPVIVTGHSAGGHLAARLGNSDLTVTAPISRIVPIAPLADLEPLMLTSMNSTLAIDDAEAAAESPARLPLRAGCSAHVWVGAQERPAFLWQARLLSEEWACPWTAAPGRHHFDVIDDLADPASALIEACLGPR
jgi:acetyl esterase/lipase